jgi:hypothetical protein
VRKGVGNMANHDGRGGGGREDKSRNYQYPLSTR